MVSFVFVLLLLFWVFLALAQGPAFFVDLKKWFSLCLRVCRVLMFLLPLREDAVGLFFS